MDSSNGIKGKYINDSQHYNEMQHKACILTLCLSNGIEGKYLVDSQRCNVMQPKVCFLVGV